MKKDCQMFRFNVRTREPTCYGLNQLYCEHEEDCAFYKPCADERENDKEKEAKE